MVVETTSSSSVLCTVGSLSGSDVCPTVVKGAENDTGEEADAAEDDTIEVISVDVGDSATVLEIDGGTRIREVDEDPSVTVDNGIDVVKGSVGMLVIISDELNALDDVG